MDKQLTNLKEYVESAFSNGHEPVDLSWIEELKSVIGEDAVLVDEETIDLHSYDAWPVAAKWKNQGKRPFAPDVVVKAHSTEQVSKLLKWANEKNIPVTPWGGGSSVTGQGLPSKGGIVLDTMSMNRIIALSDESLVVKVQAGKYGHRLEEALNARGFTLNHSPQSLDRSTVGGWVATRAMGQFSSRYGGIEDLVVCFTVVLPTGEVVETMNVPRAAVGPDLRHIFMGAEGTMGVITDVTLKIFPLAEYRLFEAVTFDSVEAGVTVMRQIMRLGLKPFLVRFYDFVEARHAMQDKTFDKCVMFLGFEGVQTVALAEYGAVMDLCVAEGGEKIGPSAVEAWMRRRFDFSTVENLLAETGGLAETIEIAHFWDGILETYYELKEALAPYAAEVLGHFSHVYPQGTSLYVILLGQDVDDASAEANLLEVWDVAMHICVKNGAAISHHHGSGLARLPYVTDALGSSMPVLKKIKTALDPKGIMNPEKLGL
ncbi:FAD-binding oxidoreductase [Candidatus Leptofilum sp.]|uniref:FAD-binding oxidoreductase n=1 Tax=Candidatus Leptofilum sp. TaxID=3241576 RepID=UPI003B5A6D7C